MTRARKQPTNPDEIGVYLLWIADHASEQAACRAAELLAQQRDENADLALWAGGWLDDAKTFIASLDSATWSRLQDAQRQARYRETRDLRSVSMTNSSYQRLRDWQQVNGHPDLSAAINALLDQATPAAAPVATPPSGKRNASLEAQRGNFDTR